MAGIFEEMLFRGFLLYSFERQMDVTKAVVLTALMFAFIHYIWIIWPWFIIEITMLGIVLGVLSWKSKSIYPAVSVHILNNLISIYYTNYETYPSILEWKGHVSPLIVILAGYFIVFGFKRFYKLCDKYKYSENETY